MVPSGEMETFFKGPDRSFAQSYVPAWLNTHTWDPWIAAMYFPSRVMSIAEPAYPDEITVPFPLTMYSLSPPATITDPLDETATPSRSELGDAFVIQIGVTTWATGIRRTTRKRSPQIREIFSVFIRFTEH